MASAHQIASEFVVMNAGLTAETAFVGDDFYAKLGQKYGDFAGNTLISCHSFASDWPTWEMHPKGDEIVILLSGAADMVFAKGAVDELDDESVRLESPGDYVIVPRGTWHTARVTESTTMIFMTPGEGTENREQPIRTGADT